MIFFPAETIDPGEENDGTEKNDRAAGDPGRPDRRERDAGRADGGWPSPARHVGGGV